MTPIPTDEEVSSLSAILLDSDYYDFLRVGRQIVDGIPIVRAEHLIPLKARTWIDLSNRKKEGQAIDSKVIKKHKNDVFRLFAIVDPEFAAVVPDQVKAGLAVFLDQMEDEIVDLNALGLGSRTLDSVLVEMRRIYAID